ncbi:6257_t:CDS:2, partial [Scutellospora calospora]
VKKCFDTSCLYCKPIRLPQHEFGNLSFLPDPIPSKDNTDHYASFQHVYETKTTEEYRPTYIQLQAKSESIPKYILVTEKIHDYISCENCRKRRCVYTPIFPDDHYLKEVIFIRLQINYDSPIEILYYSSRKAGNYPICYHCGNSDNLITPPQSLKERFKQIYPLCEICQESGRNFYIKGAVKTNNKSIKHSKK